MRTASTEAIKLACDPEPCKLLEPLNITLCSKQRNMLRELLSILCMLSAVHASTDCSDLPNDAAIDCGASSPCLARDPVNNLLQPIPTPAEK